MANPQVENGHLDIANELVEALARTQLSGHESRILWAVMRKTWGWHKKMDRISFTQLEAITGMNRRHIAPALQRLTDRQIVTRDGNGHKLEYGIQKNYTRWLSVTEIGNVSYETLPKTVTNANVTENGNTPLPKSVMKTLPISVNTKEKKETIQKKLEEQPTFEKYRDKLRTEYQDIDFDNELEKFELYWSEGGRRLKRPKLALKNWMDKAREYKRRGNGDGEHRASVRPVPKAHEYKQPSEY